MAQALEAVESDFEFVPPGRSPDSAPVRGVEAVRAWAADQQEMVGALD